MSLNCSEIEIVLPIENVFIKEKKTKVRSEKQKLNDLKLKERLTEQHKIKKLAKEQHIKLLNELVNEINVEEKQYNDDIIEIENRDNIIETYDGCTLIDNKLCINRERLDAYQQAIQEKSDIDVVLTDLGLVKKRGRPAKKQVIKEFPAAVPPVLDSVICVSN